MNGALRKAILTVAEQHPHFGPQEVAHLVAENTPVEQLRSHYRDALISTCRAVINKHRRDVQPRPQPQAPPAPRRESPKLTDRRNWWAEMLAKRIHVGDGVQKALADCTIENLEFGLKERDELRDRLGHQMDNISRLIALMTRFGARTVRQLPPQQPWTETQ